MDKKFVAWLLVVTSLFLMWWSLRQQFAPTPVQNPSSLQQPANPNATNVDGNGASKNGAVQGNEPNPTLNAANATSDGSLLEPDIKPSWHVLGSLDPNSEFRQLVYLSNRGAGIERIELIDQTKPGRFRYRSLENWDVYLGYLALQERAEGLEIGCVPLGSPASQAKPENSQWQPGLQIGDVIQEIDHRQLKTLADWHAYFAKGKPGHEALIQVQRMIDGAPQVSRFTAILTQAPLDVVRVTDDQVNENVIGNIMRQSCLTTLAQLDSDRIMAGKESLDGLERILNGNWEPRPLDVPGGMGVEFAMPLKPWLQRRGLDADLEIAKRYRLLPAKSDSKKEWDGYEIDLEVIVRNRDTKAHQVALRQEGFNGLTLEGWWYLTKIGQTMFGGAGARDIVYASTAKGHQLISRSTIYKEASANPADPSRLFLSQFQPQPQRDLQYLGIDGALFAASLVSHPLDPTAMQNIQQAATVSLSEPKMTGSKQIATNSSAWFDTATMVVEPGQEASRRFSLIAGPKAPKLLQRYGLGRLVEYGWFGFVAIPLTKILHAFHYVSYNYGIAIIMLTVLVRSSMFPISRRAALSAQKMQALAPEIKRISDIYKDDLQARTKATQEVYKKANFNPMAGCLPVFIQIPIFIGLYRAVSVDVELRQQPLIPGIEWCSNLAGPDMLLAWSQWMPDFIAGKGSGYFGPYFNLLPIITITLFIIQQKVLMPKATDEQQEATQKMMMYMTVFMGVLFFKVPAGLCIYFITSSIWSLVERRLIKKYVPQTAVASGTPALSTTTSSTVKSVAQSKNTSLPKNGDKFKPEKPNPTRASQRPETLSEAFPWLAKYFGDKGKAAPPPSNADRNPKPKSRKKRN